MKYFNYEMDEKKKMIFMTYYRRMVSMIKIFLKVVFNMVENDAFDTSIHLDALSN